MNPINLAEGRWLPDWLIRFGIRRLLDARLRKEAGRDADPQYQDHFSQQLRESSLAIATDTANDQHYEVPAEFFQTVLGPRLKYSGCYFGNADTTLAQAEDAMLEMTCNRADIQDGMNVLELGCGWGSLSIWIAEHFPRCTVTAVSNSHSQREFIENRCQHVGLDNVNVITADMRDFSIADRFDRVVSVEMFEHMRNYEELLKRIAVWLEPEGMLFIHIFCHRRFSYLFRDESQQDWISKHFFTEGMMPAANLLHRFNQHVCVKDQWVVNGLHYARTCEEWLRNLDRNKHQLLALFDRDHSTREGRLILQRWRMFFMACAESFRYGGGIEWFVSHYLLSSATIQSSSIDSSQASTVMHAS